MFRDTLGLRVCAPLDGKFKCISHTHLIFQAPCDGLDVGVQDVIDGIFGHVHERGGLENARVVEGHVQPAELFDRCVHHFLAVGFLWRGTFIHEQRHTDMPEKGSIRTIKDTFVQQKRTGNNTTLQ